MSTTSKHFSPRASLAAIGIRLRRLGLFEAFAAHVRVPQKTVKHTPAEKLYDAFLAILSGAHGPKTVMRYDHGRENLEQNAVNFLGYDEE